MTSTRFYYPQIDGLRCLAFVMVFFSHFYDVHVYFAKSPLVRHILWPFNQRGWIGVDVFLVLSSFLIFSLLLVERQRTGTIEIRNFYIRRAIRIWPLYFPYLIFAMVVLPWLIGQGGTLQYKITLEQHLFPFLFFLGNFSYAYFVNTTTSFFGHLWTICLEEQFYIWPPLILTYSAFRSGRMFWITAAALMIFTTLCKIYVTENAIPYPALWSTPFCRMDPFIIGAALAVIVHENPRWLQAPIGMLFLAGAAAGFALVCAGDQIGTSADGIWELPVVAVSCGLLVLATLARGGIKWIFAWRPIVFLGKISFGLYVYHEIGLNIVYGGVTSARYLGVGPVSYALDFVESMSIVVGLAVISYFAYERPILKFKERFAIVRSRPA